MPGNPTPLVAGEPIAGFGGAMGFLTVGSSTVCRVECIEAPVPVRIGSGGRKSSSVGPPFRTALGVGLEDGESAVAKCAGFLATGGGDFPSFRALEF